VSISRPHDLEFLREEHAHLRLGFRPKPSRMDESGRLDVALHRTLPPEPGPDGKIAVSLCSRAIRARAGVVGSRSCLMSE